MEDLSLHILDIAENSTSAGATLVEISVIEDSNDDRLTIVIKDNGKGMDEEMVNTVRDPFVTTRTTRRVGLGISLLEQSALDADGDLFIKSEPGKGTEITVNFVSSHIDRKPLGDLGETFITLILSNPEIDFVFETVFNGEKTIVDTREIKKELDGVSITEPEVLRLIKDLF